MPKVNTNSIQNQVYKVNSTTTYSVNGSTSSDPVLLRDVEIQPNTFTIGDIVTVEAVVTKQGTSGTWGWGLFWNNFPAYDITTDIPIINSPSTTFAAGVTYSTCYRKLVIGGTAGSVIGTGAWNPDLGNYFADVFFQPNTFGATWQKVGENTNNGESIDWDSASFDLGGSYLNGGNFKIIGYVNNPNDRIRVEWMKVSGFASGSFIIPSQATGG